MSNPIPTETILRVSDLQQNQPTAFSLKPSGEDLAALASELQLSAIKKLVFEGDLRAVGAADWELRATLGVTVVQPCVVTLDPVTTRIDETVERRFLKDMPVFDADEEEVEMPEDENAEPLQSTIDLTAVMHESLALLVPQFPRADGAQLKKTAFTEPGKAAMTDEDARPFAGLAALRAQLSNKEDE